MFTGGILTGIGVAATAVGMGATLVSSWVSDKKMEEKIEEKINEILAQKDEEE